jgi:triacylglycerol esterase/lipase EstA (alpha/beta hydrolase family)
VDYGQHIEKLRAQSAHNDEYINLPVVLGDLDDDWEWNERNPVHMLCHSQGGNTVRLLIQLLSKEVGPANDPWKYKHPTYFPRTKDEGACVRSVVTLGTPHKGTTVTEVVQVSLRLYFHRLH